MKGLGSTETINLVVLYQGDGGNQQGRRPQGRGLWCFSSLLSVWPVVLLIFAFCLAFSVSAPCLGQWRWSADSP